MHTVELEHTEHKIPFDFTKVCFSCYSRAMHTKYVFADTYLEFQLLRYLSCFIHISFSYHLKSLPPSNDRMRCNISRQGNIKTRLENVILKKCKPSVNGFQASCVLSSDNLRLKGI